MPYKNKEDQKDYYHRTQKHTTKKWREQYRRWNDYQREYKRKKRGTVNYRLKDWEEKEAIDFDKLTYYGVKLLNHQIDSKRRKSKGKVLEGEKNLIKVPAKKRVEKSVNWEAVSFYANKAPFVRPVAQYTNSRTPFGIADELHCLNVESNKS